jgi:ketosteroid isomerase-like protein
VRHALTALANGDVEAAAAVVHPDVTWAADPVRPPLRGRDEFREYWTGRLAATEIEFEPLAFEAEAGELRVVLHEAARNRAGGGGYGEFHARRRFRFRDGLIAEMTRGRGAS